MAHENVNSSKNSNVNRLHLGSKHTNHTSQKLPRITTSLFDVTHHSARVCRIDETLTSVSYGIIAHHDHGTSFNHTMSMCPVPFAACFGRPRAAWERGTMPWDKARGR